MRHLTLILSILAISGLAAAGCGSDDDSGGAAAEHAPAGAVVYGEFTLAPEGDQKAAVDEIVSKFPGEGSAGSRIRDLIEEGLRAGDAPISYENDIEPWLGDEAAFFVAGSGKGGDFESSAALIATDDEDAARDALAKSFEGKPQEKSFEGADYLYDAGEDTAGGVLDGFVVLGTEAGFREAVKSGDGDSQLSGDDAYTNAVDDAPEDRLGLFFVNSPRLLDATQQNSGTALPPSVERIFEEPYVATIDADADGVTFEADLPESLAKAVPVFGGGSDLVGALPSDAWLAVGQPDLGKTLDYYVDTFAESVGGRDAVEQQFRAVTGLDLGSGVIDWMGDFAIFVRGTSVAELNGALVIETTDPDASARLIERLRTFAGAQGGAGTRVGPLTVPGGGEGFTLRSADVAQAVHVFQRDDRMVVAYGDSAAADAVDAPETLADSPEYSDATKSLEGYDVSLYMAVAPILRLVESAGAASPEYEQAKPYLEPLGALIAGSAGDADELRSAFKITVP